MGISKECVFESAVALLGVGPYLLRFEAHILINRNGHACIADSGLFGINFDQAIYLKPFSPIKYCGPRWTSPELIDPEMFGLDGCPTRESDCYALGMVIYEVLSGQVPFYWHGGPAVILKVLGGGRPEKPQGMQGAWFTDELWGLLERCWKRQPHNRPSIKTLLEYLEGVVPRPQHHPDTQEVTEALKELSAFDSSFEQ